MDKKILEEYTHACILLKETEEEIQALDRKRTPEIFGKVKGNNPEFPCQARSFTISGTAFDDVDEKELRKQRQILEERRVRAKKVKLRVEEWMNIIPMRMQRIIKYKFFEEMTWEETAAKISGKATGDSIRMEYHNFMRNQK
ncbi:MAG: RNA polymerase subunit sigma-70 [Lachnospiraceae bacterium]|nr:RNA polymerase subunit sigma-70 [Lachnospiraceae bacterium]